MFLKKLTANYNSFNEIEFCPEGINIILGKNTSKKTGKSVNGVGKTLSLRLIDFCLGASINKKNSLSKLIGWEFTLVFQIGNKEYSATRSIDNNKKIYLNNELMDIKEFNRLMEQELFNCYTNTSLLSYRSLISRFIRLPKDAYITWNICKEKEQQDTALINNALLLGIDTNLILTKIKLKNKINELKSNKKMISNNDDIKSIIKGTDIGVNITSLNSEINKLKKVIENFEVTTEYNNLKTELEENKYKKNSVMNNIAIIENYIKNIDENLKIKVDVTSEQVLELYKNAKIIFKDDIVKELNEVSEFHQKLLENRQRRLKIDREKFWSELNDLKEELVLIDNKIKVGISYLKDKGTLSEYDTLRQKLSDMELRLYKFKEYENILSEIDMKVNTLKKDMAEEDIKSVEYLSHLEEKNEISDVFKEFVDFIYNNESRVSGIKINSNNRENKIRFDIEPEIESEQSGGINNVKIFCMDMLYLVLQKNNNIKFIYHDSLLFSETDPRQVYNMIKLAKKICDEKKVQYIFNINYDMYENIKNVAEQNEDEEFNGYIDSRVIKELCDDSPEHKLLGINIK